MHRNTIGSLYEQPCFGYTLGMVKIIGVDVGTKRVGLAYGTTDDGFAFPLKVIQVKNIGGTIDVLADEIVKEHQLLNSSEQNQGIIVLGESKNFKGNENPIMTHVHQLKQRLEQRGYQVVLIPEFMTSAEASRFQGDHQLLDASAATIILQSYLDIQKQTHKRQ